jgi:hypothetical protein
VLELGSAYRGAERYAVFSTQGETIWATARLQTPGGFLPDTDRTMVEIGSADDPPTHNSRTGETNADVMASVKEGFWTPVELDEGVYWVWSTNGGDVAIQTCTRGAILDPVPASASD